MRKAIAWALIIQIMAIVPTTPAGQPGPLHHSSALLERLNAAYLARGADYRPHSRHLRSDGSPLYVNRLILEDSPYLLQHAHNPVDWYPWGAEAFARARRENKPILLSIGYSTCHWCHVMERESFEDLEVARYLNTHFISIKVDRETLPDVDEIYMNALLVLTGEAGWPMTLFLTPDGKPFHAGTYYPREQFLTVLRKMHQIWVERQKEAKERAEKVIEAIMEEERHIPEGKTTASTLANEATRTLVQALDPEHGGFGIAPRFPSEPWLFLLLDQSERKHDMAALRALTTTLDGMSRGGIRDQVGGGFHRYATDSRWRIPHFEKMLYNQANLARVYLGAWRLTANHNYRQIVVQTLDFVRREMLDPRGGFYSAIDAESSGEEGRFYTWTEGEIRDALDEADAHLAIELYDITPEGNLRGRNVLYLPRDLTDFARQHDLTPDALQDRMNRIRHQLLLQRARRPAPQRDKKVITAWNGMMISAYVEAASLLGAKDYAEIALRAAEFLWSNAHPAPGHLLRVSRPDSHTDQSLGNSPPGTLDDYACLADALLDLYDLTRDTRWLQRAKELADAMTTRFFDPKSARFYLSEAAPAPGIVLPRPIDNAIDDFLPSATAVAIRVLQRLEKRTGERIYRKKAEQAVSAIVPLISDQPTSHAYLLTALNALDQGELDTRGFAAGGRIRLEGTQTPMDKHRRQIKIRMEIPSGWHINANQTNSGNVIPTRITLLQPDDGWKPEKVIYPASQRLDSSPLDTPLLVYTGSITVNVMLRRDDPPPHTQLPLPVKVSLQACSTRICLPQENTILWVVDTNRLLKSSRVSAKSPRTPMRKLD